LIEPTGAPDRLAIVVFSPILCWSTFGAAKFLLFALPGRTTVWELLDVVFQKARTKEFTEKCKDQPSGWEI